MNARMVKQPIAALLVLTSGFLAACGDSSQAGKTPLTEKAVQCLEQTASMKPQEGIQLLEQALIEEPENPFLLGKHCFLRVKGFTHATPPEEITAIKSTLDRTIPASLEACRGENTNASSPCNTFLAEQFYTRGVCFCWQNNLQQAEAEFEECLRRDPQHKYAGNALDDIRSGRAEKFFKESTAS